MLKMIWKPAWDLPIKCKCSECTTSIKICFFCGKPASTGKPFNKASTLDLIPRCGIGPSNCRTNNYTCLTEHRWPNCSRCRVQCLVFLHNRTRLTKKFDDYDADTVNHGITFARLVSYNEDACRDDLVAPVFKLKHLVNLCGTRLDQLGTDVKGCIHSTKLKDRLLRYLQHMEAHKQGRDAVLVSNKNIGSTLRKTCKCDADDNAFFSPGLLR